MDYINNYIKRMKDKGNDSDETYIANSKSIVNKQILNSRTKSKVYLNFDKNNTYYCIANDVSNRKKRKFIFQPDTDVKVGDYITENDDTYLLIEKHTDIIRPQLIGELCNSTFKLQLDLQEIVIGYDDFGRPEYDYQYQVDEEIPCVLQDNPYSISENSTIPLPDGTIKIKIPYNNEKIPPINYDFIINNIEYKITSISYENVINEKGYIEIIASKDTRGDS